MESIGTGSKTIQKREEPLAGQGKNVWKSVIEELMDPAKGMDQEEERAYAARIESKLKRGKKLTAKEMDYLRVYNPELYKAALRVKMRKEQLEQQLKNCRSKEEAADVARRAFSGISKEDPHRAFLVAGLNETIRQFKKSSAYARLPQTEEPDRKRKKRGRGSDFKEETEEDTNLPITPIQEVLDELPAFDVVQ